MSDLWTVFRKELMEVFGDRQSFRGALVQAAILLGFGVFVPYANRSFWEQPMYVLMLYVIFPAALAGAVAADAFAGELERRTLETLLATPLGDAAIFLGKAAVTVTFVFVVSTLALLAGLATAHVRGFIEGPMRGEMLLAVLGGALAGATLTAAAAIAVSVRVPVARAAQQMASGLTMLLGALAVAVLGAFETLRWTTVLRVDALGLALGLLGLFVAMRLFRRDRLFEAGR